MRIHHEYLVCHLLQVKNSVVAVSGLAAPHSVVAVSGLAAPHTSNEA